MNRTRGWISSGSALLLLTTLFLTIATGNRAVSAQRRNPKTNAAVVGDLYRTNCARCHGAEGRGDTPWGESHDIPNFTDHDWWREHAKTTTRGKLLSVVTNGKAEMPAFGKKLNRSQIELLVDYVRRFRKSGPPPLPDR
jgi:mono/diheme cytochrome c family protein